MTGQRQLQTAAHGRAGQRSKNRLGHGVHVCQQVRQGRQTRFVRFAELGDIGTTGKIAATTDEQKTVHVLIVLAFLDGIENALQHPFVH